MNTPNTPAGGAVACCHCGAPCREEVSPRGGDNGWGDDKSRTVRRYAPPAAVPLDAVLALVEKFDTITTATGGCSDGYCLVTGKAKGVHTNGGCRCSTNRHAAQRVMQAARMLRDELEALTREATK